MNFTTDSYQDQLSSQVPEPYASRIFRLVLYAIVFVLTVGGNVLVCTVVINNRKLRSMQRFYYGYFLMNLAFADLAVALLCIPFTVVYYETGNWPFSAFMCKLVPTLQVTSVSASIFTLTVMTYERYQAIVQPLKAQIPKKKVLTMLGMAWIFAFVSASPEIFAYQFHDNASQKFQCRELWPHQKYRQSYTMFLFVCTYLFPLMVIFPTYIKMMSTLKKSHSFNNTDKKLRWKSLRVLIAVVIIFATSYLPQHILFLAMDFGSGLSFPYFEITLKYCYLMVWVSSCSNPIIYGALDDYFRDKYARILRHCVAVKRSTKKLSRATISYSQGTLNPQKSSPTEQTLEKERIPRDQSGRLEEISSPQSNILESYSANNDKNDFKQVTPLLGCSDT
ncbi:galanin receptor type 1-like [Actinia tenebrosa]|uniref:Galanin receptor type 1-like n=1 Tax=Actinia tenebrosa TaxID=6105 RepID=A0A6P8IDT4_ACTTE|nr:galanin receptor type 1-like [Actinia tenebrosa]